MRSPVDHRQKRRSLRRRVITGSAAFALLCGAGAAAWQARAALPRWMQDAVSGSAIEAALYRVMEMPGVKALYPRPPKEAQGELSGLIGKAPNDAELYSLRAMEEEQALDFNAAEADWKAYVAHAQDAVGAKLELADYYHRRLQTAEEVKALMEVGATPAAPREEYVAASEQRSWKAFERLLALTAEQGLNDETIEKAYAAWIVRYPQQPSLYARELRWMLDQSADRQNLKKADALIEQYRHGFPQDAVFPLKASALVAYRRGSVDKALAIYDAGFQPLWPAELVSSYYSLLGETHQLRRFSSDARARLLQSPDDLNAMARLFYYAQQQGNLEQAQQTIDGYRLSKENRKASWTAQELYTLATLTEAIHAYPEAARYDFALYHAQGALPSGGSPQETGLSGIIRILLTAPEQPVELGAGNLTMYRDLATLDRGPGYWNGILSLWLNSTSPEQAYHEEEQRAQPYFHRAKAAELLVTLDKNYSQATQRAELHRELIRVYADYGESALVLKAGDEYLRDFTSPAEETNRVLVAMYMADAYARQRNTKGEFALYDRMLTELGGMTSGMPLTATEASSRRTVVAVAPTPQPGEDAQAGAGEPRVDTTAAPKKIEKSAAFEIGGGQPAGVSIAGAQEYREVLERYLGRLTAAKQLPQALAVLRHELDRNPNDPLLYERLAAFLEQNRLGAQQEEVYNQAIQKFQDRGWYDKLARLYLREKKREAFSALTKQVTGIFAGTELEAYFRQVTSSDAQMYLQLNLYAHDRFPHDEVFVRNLLTAYRSKGTYDDAAWEKLLREHWSDTEELRQEFFDFLSRTGKLEGELAQLRALAPSTREQAANPAAARELAEAEMWRSHFETSAPLLNTLAEAYPADAEIGTQASSIDRSLAYYDASQTAKAVAVEKRLLAYDPSNLDRLARIGDVYSDAGADGTRGHENLASAAPYWRRMPQVHPGVADGYLQAATVFWDYFQFEDALGEIRAAREKFHKPVLYGYEAGAIDEGKRDFAAAIHEYTTAALAENEGEASGRLMQLARRKATAKAVDEETARAVAANGTDTAALILRARVLEVQKRSAEIGSLLEAALGRAAAFEQAQAIAAQAQARSLPKVYELALQKEIALAHDPVEKIELSYELVRSYEARNNMGDAAQVIDAVYRENPKLLGVVRTTTDFYWRNKQPAKAITTLTEAAAASTAAQPALSRQFVVEAADKANQSENYAQARELMAALIDPVKYAEGAYNAQYLAVVAESYARGGDDAGLKQFYLNKLNALRSAASMTADERKQKTALLRRGLIPALTRMKDYTGAVDQYIAILSAYPEDAGTVQEAALYALRYGRQQQLVDFGAQTVKASPRDSRFAIVLAQVQTILENYPAAIDAYAHAISIRADRSDVFGAKADLEERLQRLDDACKDYERLYVLSYQDPQWMVKVASVRARQGRKQDAVKALQRAWIEGHPATAPDYFRVAAQLESWQMLEDALQFAELGRKAEGDAFLAGAEPGEQSHDDAQGAAIYARLMTKLRQQEKALAVLDAARAAAAQSPNSPGVVLAQVEKQGLAAVSNEEWRKRRVDERRSTAAQRFRSAAMEVGKTAGTYFTPEEKQDFTKLVETRWRQTAWQSDGGDKLQWIDVAVAAGVKDEEARLRREILLDSVSNHTELAAAQYEPYLRLQRSRMEYAELAKTLTAYADTLMPDQASIPRIAAADACRDAGDEKSELAVLRSIGPNGALRERLLGLLLKHNPAEFESYDAKNGQEDAAYAAPNYAMAHADFKSTRATLSTRAVLVGGAWEPAYAALVGLYFRDMGPDTEASFHSVLDDEKTIGEKLQTRVHATKAGDFSALLTGNVWFYYGMRYGVYRTLAPQGQWTQRDPEDFLPAELERNASAVNYAGLARAYADAGQTTAALTEYGHALELAPDSAAVHDAMALLLWNSNRRDEAVAQWREALAALNRVQNKGAAPESFWTSFALVARHAGNRKLGGQLHGDMETVLRGYLARNGNYRSNELLRAAFEAAGGGSDGVAWLIALSGAATDPASILSEIGTAAWLPMEVREPILLRELELARMVSHPENGNSAMDWRLMQAQRSLLHFYVAQKQDSKAEAVLAQMNAQQRKEEDIFEAEVELAARGHRLAALLAGLNASPTEQADAASPPQSRRFELLRNAAARLTREGDNAGSLAIWEFVFAQTELNHSLMASDYLGLANARLVMGDVAGAVTVLRRMTLHGSDAGPEGSANSTSSYDEAARLLEENGHDAEALEFLTALVKEAPWNAAYGVRLAKAQLRVGKDRAGAVASLAAVAASSGDAYDLRAQAALAIVGEGSAGKLGSEELQLLAAGKVTAQQAQKPYFAGARIAAADAITDTAQRAVLLRQAVAIAPEGIEGAAGLAGADLRLKVFRVEAAAGHDATAIEVLRGLLGTGAGEVENPDMQGDEVGPAAEASAEGGADVAAAADEDSWEDLRRRFTADTETLADLERQVPLPGSAERTDAEKLALAAQIAQVDMRTGNEAGALPYLKLAAALEKDAAHHAQLVQQWRQIQVDLAVEARNAPRRPVIRKALDQSNVVRPRVTAAEAKAEIFPGEAQ